MYQATARSQDYLALPPSPQLNCYPWLKLHVCHVGAPAATIHTGLFPKPLLSQPDCWPSFTLRYASHTPGGLFSWLIILRKQWDWLLCLPSSISWADSVETAYVWQERILNKSKISDLWFCLYWSGRHTSDFTVVPDLRLPRTAPNCGEDWEPLVICPRHLPTASLRTWSNYILVMACERGKGQDTDCKLRHMDATHVVPMEQGAAESWYLGWVFSRGCLEHDELLRKPFQHQATSRLSGT